MLWALIRIASTIQMSTPTYISNDYTQHTFHDKIRNFPLNIHKYLFSWAIKRISWGLKNEFELAIVNVAIGVRIIEVYCILIYVYVCDIVLFLCVEVLRPSQLSSAVSLPNHTFTGQA